MSHRDLPCTACSGDGSPVQAIDGQPVAAVCWACRGERTQEAFLACLARDDLGE